MQLRRDLIVACLMVQNLMAQTPLIDVIPGGLESNEPSLAIYPNNPNVQILGSNTDYFFISEDAGYNWKFISLKPKEGFYGDPVTYIDKQGRFYLASLSQNPGLEWPEHFDRIVLQTSDDNGQTWKSSGIGYRPGKMQDKPWIAVDENKASSYKGSVYVSWTEFDKYGSKDSRDSSRIRFAFRRYDSDTFTTAVVSDTCGDAIDNDGTLEGATCAVGVWGEIYCVWAGKNKIWMDVSHNGGKTWGVDQVIAEQTGGWAIVADIPGLMRSNNMPFIKSDARGNLYLVYGDKRNGDYDIFLKMSSDGGKIWTEDIRLNNDTKGNGRDQYMPHIAMDVSSSILYAVWYDRRHSENNIYTDVYLRAVVKGKPGKEYRITNQSFCPPGKKVFFGDYIAVAAYKGIIRAAFTDFDNQSALTSVKIAALSEGFVKRNAETPKSAYMEMSVLPDTTLFLVHFALPRMKSCTLEMSRGRQILHKQLFDPLHAEEQEVALPLNKIPPGVYKVSLSAKGSKMTRELYIGKP
ncbi:MAG: exo-alpha-sialidase [Bacteroidetes bacterium]|nr:exo-alpha-sialidase [Bacteroidota bacterium]